MANDMIGLFQQPARNTNKNGANYGTPYQPGETPLGENLEHGELPTSIRKSFRRHPDIEALSLLPEQMAYDRMSNDIAINGIQVPIILWRTTRITTDEREITEYIVVDGYLRLRIAEQLKVPMESIPWIVNEDIHTLEEAISTAIRLKTHRSHYNECERKYMIGLRYLQEKKRVGAPLGSMNAAKENDLDRIQNESENNVPKVGTLNSRTIEVLAKELNVGKTTIQRYAQTAQNIELVADEIVSRWGVSKAVAVRCCTQLYIKKYDKDGNELDARLVSASDWAALNIQQGQLDTYPLQIVNPAYDEDKKPNELSHYHDEREEAILAAVRDVVTPPRMRPKKDYIDVKYTEVNAEDKYNSDDQFSRALYFARMEVNKSKEELAKIPEYVEWRKEQEERANVDLQNTAQTHPEKRMRLEALRKLAFFGLPLPTDELDQEEVEVLRRTTDPKYEQSSSITHLVREYQPKDSAWDNYSELAHAWDKVFRRYRDTLIELETAADKLLEESRVMADKYQRGEVKMIVKEHGAPAARLKEAFLEIAKVLYDTTANQQCLVVNRDPGLNTRIKSKVTEAFDSFRSAAPDLAGEIQVASRYKEHRKHPIQSSVAQDPEARVVTGPAPETDANHHGEPLPPTGQPPQDDRPEPVTGTPVVADQSDTDKTTENLEEERRQRIRERIRQAKAKNPGLFPTPSEKEQPAGQEPQDDRPEPVTGTPVAANQSATDKTTENLEEERRQRIRERIRQAKAKNPGLFPTPSEKEQPAGQEPQDNLA
ncbi:MULTISPECIES: hypothetical protein [Acidithiobacillus]|uniref:hypothetical protein n=1 Tax=Acidithiobacillus TaxID=119977 RepID=UPI00094AE729|nr:MULTISPECIES: hypothetical protein [Acidithiobacillus]MBE7564127.1 hypothetical protein [Acidithiobacillus sp. HP-6]MBE7570856.1 hypothetical protein [Acidithiobacillus sp. HP-2]